MKIRLLGICPVCQTKHGVRREVSLPEHDVPIATYYMAVHDGPSGEYCEGSGQTPQAFDSEVTDYAISQ